MIASRIPDPYRPHPALEEEHHPLIAREAVRPGAALALGSIGYATVAAFVVLHLDARGVGHGAAVFGAFATMVVLTRLVAGDLPDRVGPARVAIAAALAEAVGLVDDRGRPEPARRARSARWRWGPPSRCSTPRSR